MHACLFNWVFGCRSSVCRTFLRPKETLDEVTYVRVFHLIKMSPASWTKISTRAYARFYIIHNKGITSTKIRSKNWKIFMFEKSRDCAFSIGRNVPPIPFFSYFSSPNGTPTIPYTRTLTSFVVIHGTMKKSLRLHCKLWSRFLYTKFSLNWENRRRKGEGKALIGKCWVETFRLFIDNLLCC